jgi:hypothetical protein
MKHSFRLDTLLLTKYLVTRQFWIAPSKPQLPSEVSSATYFKLGFFLDYDCETSKQVFWEVSYQHLLLYNLNKKTDKKRLVASTETEL